AEPGPIQRLDAAGLVRPEALPTPGGGRGLRLDDALFVDDVLIWPELNSEGLTYGAPGAPAIRVEFPGMPMLGIWTKVGAPYV
ncbi:hypothetical protein KC221_27985, partial [Mycobacterium tuberculosis]|nr:hypothetical protein [Mycobacterium tuberculosis]